MPRHSTILTPEPPMRRHPPYCCAEKLLDDLEWASSRVLLTLRTNPLNHATQQANNSAQPWSFDERIQRKIGKNRDLFVRFSSQPLHYTLHREVEKNRAGSGVWPHQRLALLRCLLSHGHDPNAPMQCVTGKEDSPPETPWTQLVRRVVPMLHFKTVGERGASAVEGFNATSSCLDEFLECLERGVFRCLLDHDANPNARISNGNSPALPVWAIFLLLGLHALPGLESQSQAYLDALDMMLCRADFGRPEDGLSALVREFVTKNKMAPQFSTPAFSSLRKQQARKRMMELIHLQLERNIHLGSGDEFGGAYITQDSVNLKIDCINLFMTRAAHPSVPMAVLRSRIPRSLQWQRAPPQALSPAFYYAGSPCPIRSAVPRPNRTFDDYFPSDSSDSEVCAKPSADIRSPKRMRTGY